MKLKRTGPTTTELHLTSGVVVLISYEMPVAALIPGEGYKRTDTYYSVTTSKHINRWLEDVRAETKPQEFFDGLIS